MTPYSRHLLIGWLLITGLNAQNIQPETTEEDPVQAAIRAFNDGVSSRGNEVTVVLPPPEPAKPPKETEKDKKPVLVTGKPPVEPEVDPSENPPIEDEPKADKRGLQVRVATLDGGSGKIDPKTVELLTPFPPKPLAQAPNGWILKTSENAPPFTRKVELSSGKSITLTIEPHIMVPDTSTGDIFAIEEPSFENSLGYTQKSTVSAVLADSIQSLDEDASEMGQLIDQLEQLLVSLPKPEKPVE